MGWRVKDEPIDILVERKLDEAEIRAGLAVMFEVGEGDVFLFQEVAEVPLSPWPRVPCYVRFMERGEFRTRLSPLGALKMVKPALKAGSEFAQRVGCRCVIGDEWMEPLNPGSAVLFEASGQYRLVSLYESDEGDEYHVRERA